MSTYEVNSNWLNGRNKIFTKGQIVKTSDFIPGHADRLCIQNSLILISNDDRILVVPPSKPIKGVINIVLVTAVWKRPEVFELFAKGVHLLEEMPDINLKIVVAGSEGETSRNMVEKHGFHYIETPNQPLGRKVSVPVEYCRKMDVDYILCVGSDDIITPELMLEYLIYMRQGIDFIGISDFYFHDLKTKQFSYWGGYLGSRKGESIGAGRLLSKRLVQHLNWQPWNPLLNSRLDHSMQMKLKTIPYSKKIFSLKEKGLYAFDIKSDVNITPFALWENTVLCSSDEFKTVCPYLFTNNI